MTSAPPFAPVAADLARLETMLQASIEADGEAGQAVGQLLGAGGKRLRPALLLLAARLGPRYDFDSVAPAALGVELAHAATLIHDDVIDSAPTRRGVPTLSALHGDATAIVVGDYYFAKAYRETSRARGAELVPLLAETVMQMCVGELRQQAMQRRYRIELDEYTRRIELKTARLFAYSCIAGAVLGGLDEQGESALASYGLALGLAFQVADDVLDYAASEAETGKPVAHDLLEGNSTLPLLLALADPRFAEQLRELVVEGSSPTVEQVAAVVEIVRASEAITQARAVARRHADDARAALRRFPDSPPRQALAELCDYVVLRTG